MTDPTPADPVLGVKRIELPLAPETDQGGGCGCGGTAAKQLVARLRAERAARAAAASTAADDRGPGQMS